MDDPWGSPWATNENPQAATSGLTLEPPPRALLSSRSRSSSKNNLSPASPWDKDDELFGDWASADATDATNTNINPWAAWADASPQPSPRRDSPKKETLTAWPAATSAGPSPAIQPLPQSHSPLASTPSLSRQPSFDPWKSEAPADALVEHSTSPNIRVDPISVSLKHEGPNSNVDVFPTGSDARPEMEQLDVPSSLQGEVPKPQAAATSGGDVQSLEAGSRSHSRASSRSSKSGKREEFAKDSPITSIDDDPKDASTREKPATKVQELVDMYDGLANKQYASDPESLRLISKTGQKSESAQVDDFGDFEDAGSQDTEPNDGHNSQSQPELQSIQSAKEGSPRKDETSSWGQEVSSPISPSPRRKHSAKVSIDVPMESLDRIFPAPRSLAKLPNAGNLDTMGHVIYDTFAETSERRTWFRISRFGSMLRNESPDFENYTSVQWPHTKTHEETLQIVNRWMQGAAPGASGSTGNGSSGGFGWDSSAPTVSMQDIFGRKRPHTISTTSGGILKPLAAPLRSPAPASSQAGSATTATFAWSSSPTELEAQTVRSQPTHQKPTLETNLENQMLDSNPNSTASLSVPSVKFEWGSFDVFESKEEPQIKPIIPEAAQTPQAFAEIVEKGASLTSPANKDWRTNPNRGADDDEWGEWDGKDSEWGEWGGNDDDDVKADSNDDEWGEWGEIVSSPTGDAAPFPFPAEPKPDSERASRAQKDHKKEANNILKEEQKVTDGLISFN